MTPTSRSMWAPICAVLIVVAAGACDRQPAANALRYTTRVEVVEPADGQVADADAVLDQMVPGGRIEMTTLISEYGVRLEWLTPPPGLPAGAVLLHLPDGTVRLLDPEARRAWTIPTPAAPADAPTPRLTTAHTGEMSEVGGVPTERVTFEIGVDLPDRGGTGPAALALEGEAWVAAQFSAYTKLAFAALPAAQSLGLESIAGEGLQMRQVLRSPTFGGREVVTTVTAVAEEVVTPDVMEVPSGYETAGPFLPGR